MAPGDRRLIMSPLRTLLLAVGRHLRRERWTTTARYSAWGAVLVALLAVLLHVSVRPVPLGELALCLVLIGLVAAVQALAYRPSPVDCADWADRHLGGRSGYGTCLEVSARPRRDPDAATQHLDAWVAQAVPSSLAQLAARPFDAGLRKPFAAALVCVALAMALLQLPTGARAPEATSASARATAAGSALTDQRGRVQQPSSRALSARDAAEPTTPAQATAHDKRSTATAPADARDADARSEQPQDDETALAARATREAAGTGREAGDVADTGGENLFTAPWQGELAARLRDIATQAPRRDLRADARHDADFMESTAAVTGHDGDGSLVAAAATPPPASASPPLSPAERAYLRAYLSDRRTDP